VTTTSIIRQCSSEVTGESYEEVSGLERGKRFVLDVASEKQLLSPTPLQETSQHGGGRAPSQDVG